MNVFLLGVMMLLQFLDGAVTYYGLEFTNRVAEANPLAVGMISTFGTVVAILIAKGVWFAMASYLMVNLNRMVGWGWTVGISVPVAMYSYVLYNNILLVLGI